MGIDVDIFLNWMNTSDIPNKCKKGVVTSPNSLTSAHAEAVKYPQDVYLNFMKNILLFCNIDNISITDKVNRRWQTW